MYQAIDQSHIIQFPFAHIWKLKTPPRINLFLWRVAHDRLMTNMERERRGISDNGLFPRCQQAPESIMHLLRDCEFAMDLWVQIVDPEKWHIFASLGQA